MSGTAAEYYITDRPRLPSRSHDETWTLGVRLLDSYRVTPLAESSLLHCSQQGAPSRLAFLDFGNAVST